ncbi:copper chaperone [Labrys neptuniae]
MLAGTSPLFTPAARGLWARRAPRYAAALALPAWALLLAMPVMTTPSACLGGSALAALASPARLANFVPALPWASHWLAMVCAMMVPLALPMLTLIEARSLPSQRARALAAFLAGHVTIWFTAGALFYGVALAAVAMPTGVLMVTAALSFAWHMNPLRARMIMACHRTRPLASGGVAGLASAGSFGAGHGLHCVASCGHLMLPLLFINHGALLAVTTMAISLHERGLRRPDPRAGALMLGLIWALALI